jgi:hypothetical protein
VQPLGDLVAVIEQATGIDVAVLDAGPDEHGLTMRDPVRGTVFIGVARTRNPMTLRTPQLAGRFGWADQYQVLQASSDRRRAPQRLLARAIAGYVEGVLPAQAIASLRGISVEALMGEFGEAGVTPAARPIAWADPDELPDVEAEKHRMSVRPIIDAGPGLNFLSINKERLLIGVLGPLSAPRLSATRSAQVRAG